VAAPKKKLNIAPVKHPQHSFKREHHSTPKPMSFRGNHGEGEFVGLQEPTWPSTDEQATWTEDHRGTLLSHALGWYNYTQNSKVSIEFLLQAFEKYPYRAETLRRLKKATLNMPPVAGWLCRMAAMGLVLTMSEKRFLCRNLRKVLKSEVAEDVVAAVTSTEPVIVKLNIQDHLNAKVKDTFGEIERLFDDYINSNYQKIDVMKVLFAKAPPINKTKDLIKMADHYLEEINEVINGRDEQLNEAYKPYGKRGVKQLAEFWKQVITDINNYGLHRKKAKGPRKKKAVSPDKMVSKLAFLKTFEPLNLSSIDPTVIIRSSELWIFNTKTRKLGVYYVSAASSSFEVKGKRILNADPIVSMQKTLRKPKEQLAEFSNLGKPARRAWFKKIKGIEIKLKPIINKDSILLSASK